MHHAVENEIIVGLYVQDSKDLEGLTMDLFANMKIPLRQ